MNKHKISWSLTALDGLRKITSKKLLIEITNSPKTVTFPEQFQFDEYRTDCRRIIVGNFKLLYQHQNNTIYIVRVFNTSQNPLKSLR